MQRVSEDQYNDWLAHIGVDHIKGNPGSGRYPWGSGEHRYQRSGFSYDDYMRLKKEGLSDKEIAKHFNMVNIKGDPDISALRDNRSIALAYQREDNVRKATELYNNGLGYSAIGREMGMTESSVRSLLQNKAAQESKNAIFKTADALKDSVDEKGVIDIPSKMEKSGKLQNVCTSINLSNKQINEYLDEMKKELDLEQLDEVSGGYNGRPSPDKQS